jgi:ketosteroid isomerase-like protein
VDGMPRPTDRELVLSYLSVRRLASLSGDPNDLEALREYLAEDVVIELASGWADEPWRVAYRGADEIVRVLRRGLNAEVNLKTETVAVGRTGCEVFVQQELALVTANGVLSNAVCHVFTAADGRITSIRTYRNDANLPPEYL